MWKFLVLIVYVLIHLVIAGQNEKELLDGPRLSVLLVASVFTSHQLTLVALGEELVRRGHRVTFMAPIVEGSSILPDFTKRAGIDFIATAELSNDPAQAMARASKNATSFFDLMYRTIKAAKDSTEDLTGAWKKLREMNGSNWDYVVVDALAIVLHQYLVSSWGSKVMISYSPLPIIPAARPSWPHPVMFSPFTNNMSFLDRFLNTAVYSPLEWTGQMMAALFMKPIAREIGINEDFNLWNYPGLYYPVIFHTVMGFVYPKTAYPMQHYVGPLISKNPPPLDKDLENWLAGRDELSVVYISMGSTAELTPLLAQALLNGVINEYSVVWALRESNRDCLEGIKIDSDRVFVSGWISQVAMLQHKTVAMAILHCGLGGVQEALINAVPVICLPSAWDQLDIAVRISSQGLGIRILPKELSQDKVKHAIHIIEKEKFRKQIRKMSKILKMAGGVKTAADLVEYYAAVGHDHCIPSFIRYQWSWIEYYNVDVWLVIVILVGVVIRLLHCCPYCCCISRQKK